MRLFFLLLLLVYPLHAQASSFPTVFKSTVIKSNELSPTTLRELNNKLQKLLPEKLIKALPKNLSLRFEDLGERAWGKTRKGSSELILHKSFLPSLEHDRPARAFSKEKAFRELIHELAHVYDYQFILDAESLKQVRECSEKAQRLLRRAGRSIHTRKGLTDNKDTRLGAFCEWRLKQRHSISDEAQFLYLTGWNTPEELKNTQANRIVRYALKNSKEYFATHFSLFLTDPEFKCRMPALNQYFEEHFQHQAFAESACELNTTVAINNGSTRVTLDPDRLYEIHFLHASSGKSLQQLFGHSLIRLVLCDPKRETKGPECLKDVRHHLVMSYYGFVGEMSQNLFRFITGGYPSQITFSRWTEVQKSYTKEQLRALHSIPVKATESELKLFAKRAIELQWTYRGDYKFFTNNCATELHDLFRAVFKKDFLFQKEVLSPKDALLFVKGLYENLIASDLLDLDRKEVFESYEGQLSNAFSRLNENLAMPQDSKIGDWKDYLEKSSAEERLQLLEDYAESEGADARGVYAAFYLLEDYIHQRLIDQQMSSASKLMLSAYKEKVEARGSRDLDLEYHERLLALGREADDILALKSSFLPQEIDRKSVSYGIPAPVKIELRQSQSAPAQKKLQSYYKERKEVLSYYFPRLYREIDSSKELKLKLIRHIRRVGI